MNIERLETSLSDTRFARLGRVFESVASTNDTLQALAREGAPQGSFVIATEQTSGRGRHGRHWISQPGLGLYLSVLFRPRSAHPTRWTIGAGLAACDACRLLGAKRTTLRWPNDLFADGCKLGGILVETRSSGSTLHDLVVGIGINVHHDEEDLGRLELPAVTSLRREKGSGIVGGREALAVELLTRLDLLAAKLDTGDWETVAAAWLERAPLASGATVSVLAADGRTWSGVTAGLGTDGALRVRDTTGTVCEVRQVESVRYTKEA